MTPEGIPGHNKSTNCERLGRKAFSVTTYIPSCLNKRSIAPCNLKNVNAGTALPLVNAKILSQCPLGSGRLIYLGRADYLSLKAEDTD
jgi:hypothetical protein